MNRKAEAAASREGLLQKPLQQFELSPNSYASRRSSTDSFNEVDYLSDDATPGENSRPAVVAYHGRSKLAWLRSHAKSCSTTFLVVSGVLLIVWMAIAAGGFWVYSVAPRDGLSPPWYPTPRGGTVAAWSKSYAKAAKMVEQMSLPSKVNVSTGTGWQMGLAVGNTAPALDVGFPGLALQDGPLGLRFADHATAFPAGITVGATWNKELMYARGKAHGQEARLKGINVLLGPCVGPLGRMPAGGRNWEGFGADPYLQGVAAYETIRGIQEEGVMATIKHYIGNEQEHYRQSREWALPNALSSNIGDRTLHELYLWPFADAVRAGVASVMCSYQMTNNSYSCANSKLLNGILKDELGFQGFVQSDWLAQRSGVASTLAGLDMSMPGDGLGWADGHSLWGAELTKSVLNGSVPLARLNDMVTRIVAAWYQVGQDDKKKFDRKGPNFSSWTGEKIGKVNYGSPDDDDERIVNQYVDVQGKDKAAHSIIARQVAAEGSVLVKNVDGILPLSKDGPTSAGNDLYKVTIFGDDAGEGNGPNACPDRACNKGTLGSGWGSGAVEFPYLVTPIEALRKAFNSYKVYVKDFPSNNPPFLRAPEILNDPDLCLVFVNADSGEGYLSADGIRGDRNDLEIQKKGNALIRQVADGCGGGNGDTVVVVHTVGPVILEEWIDHPRIKGVILANLPGQESGNAIVDVLFGDVNPSGKLPYTIGKSLEDYGDAGQIMYIPNGVTPQQNFSEGIYIDYRHFDKYGIKPRYEFGYGLSYTTFIYSDLKIKTMKEKSPLPSPRPEPKEPPSYSEHIPDSQQALFPEGFRKLKKFVYPYIDKLSDIGSGPYPYPEGYHTIQPLSPAGGGEGGNPSLYDIHCTVSVEITNTGPVAGAEVAQLYISYPGSAISDKPPSDSAHFDFDTNMLDFPVKVLRGFEKTMVPKGETRTVVFDVTRRDLSYWDTTEQNWIMPMDGPFIFRVGSSSMDLRAQAEF